MSQFATDNHQDNSDLPEEVAIIAGLIGRQKALYLVGVYGGRTSCYVPAEPNESHRLTRLIGLEDAKKLAAEYGRMSLKIPRCYHLERRFRDETILELYTQNYSYEAIAELFQISVRTIFNVLRRHHIIRRNRLIPVKLLRKKSTHHQLTFFDIPKVKKPGKPSLSKIVNIGAQAFIGEIKQLNLLEAINNEFQSST